MQLANTGTLNIRAIGILTGKQDSGIGNAVYTADFPNYVSIINSVGALPISEGTSYNFSSSSVSADTGAGDFYFNVVGAVTPTPYFMTDGSTGGVPPISTQQDIIDMGTGYAGLTSVGIPQDLGHNDLYCEAITGHYYVLKGNDYTDGSYSGRYIIFQVTNLDMGSSPETVTISYIYVTYPW
jgi:hypothetical protein